jgi:hypothetical protein
MVGPEHYKWFLFFSQDCAYNESLFVRFGTLFNQNVELIKE